MKGGERVRVSKGERSGRRKREKERARERKRERERERHTHTHTHTHTHIHRQRKKNREKKKKMMNKKIKKVLSNQTKLRHHFAAFNLWIFIDT